MSFRQSHGNRVNTSSPIYRGRYSQATFKVRSADTLVKLINAKVTYHNTLVTGVFASLPAEQAKIRKVRQEIMTLKEEYSRSAKPTTASLPVNSRLVK